MDDTDPTISNPEFYRLLWENDDVRVLEYRDEPALQTTPHAHPNSVMVTLSDFDRRLSSGGRSRDVSLAAGQAVWLPAQTRDSAQGWHSGSLPFPGVSTTSVPCPSETILVRC